MNDKNIVLQLRKSEAEKTEVKEICVGEFLSETMLHLSTGVDTWTRCKLIGRLVDLFHSAKMGELTDLK